MKPRREALFNARLAIKKGQVAEAHAFLTSLAEQLDASEEAYAKQVNDARFSIETHVFAGSFNRKLIDQLRQDYVRYLAYGPNKRPPQRRFVPYSSTL